MKAMKNTVVCLSITLVLASAVFAGRRDLPPRCCTVTEDRTFRAQCDDPSQVIKSLDFVAFGTDDAGKCASFMIPPDRRCLVESPVREVLESACLGRWECEVPVTVDALQVDPCPGSGEAYSLSVQWQCVDDAGNATLSSEPRPLPFEPPFHTEGRHIYDANNERVILKGVNWYGAHCGDFVTNGLDRQGVDQIARQISDLGFNVVRLQFSNQLIRDNPVISPEFLGANPQLQGLRALEIYEKIVEALHRFGVFVIMDNHISWSGWCCNPLDGNGLWYTDEFPEEVWIRDWNFMATRFKNHSNVIAAELRNEVRFAGPVGPTWGTGDPLTDWRRASTLGGNAALEGNSDLLVMITGINSGMNLVRFGEAPVELAVDNRLVYVAHDYSFWHFDEQDMFFENRLDLAFGYLVEEPYSFPLIVNEFGNCHAAHCVEHWWLSAIVDYIKKKDLSFVYWPIDGTMCSLGRTDSTRTGWGREEQYGVLNMCWNALAYQPHYDILERIIED